MVGGVAAVDDVVVGGAGVDDAGVVGCYDDRGVCFVTLV